MSDGSHDMRFVLIKLAPGLPRAEIGSPPGPSPAAPPVNVPGRVVLFLVL